MEITRGKQSAPQRVAIYGPEGIGKTSLAAQFPGAVFIDTEGSTRNFDVARYPAPSSWAALLQTVQYAMEHPQNQQTLVVDTADWAEKLCSQAVCDRAGKTGIEDFGYGKGYVYLKEEFAKLLTLLDGVISAGVHVVLTAHAALRKIELPDEMGAYDHWELKLSKQVAPMVKEWADMLLFANYKTILIQDQNGKGKAQGGRRVLYTSHHPCWDAKNRHGLPPELPMEFSAFAPAVLDYRAHDQPRTVSSNQKQELVMQSMPPEPTAQPERESAPTEAAAENPDYSGLPAELLQLMKANQVTEEEIRMVVSSKGYFPADMPVWTYPPDFVQGVLVAAWPQVLACIRSNYPEVPF